jgi:hypothetical protein
LMAVSLSFDTMSSFSAALIITGFFASRENKKIYPPFYYLRVCFIFNHPLHSHKRIKWNQTDMWSPVPTTTTDTILRDIHCSCNVRKNLIWLQIGPNYSSFIIWFCGKCGAFIVAWWGKTILCMKWYLMLIFCWRKS